jgi:uncharacterized Zn-binding protein involved in type VI secretion
MSTGIIVVGDTTSHGGKVISGDPENLWYGKPIARLGDLVDCPDHYPDGTPHGINKIIEGCDKFMINGIPVALDGHLTECGCVLQSQSNATVKQ